MPGSDRQTARGHALISHQAPRQDRMRANPNAGDSNTNNCFTMSFGVMTEDTEFCPQHGAAMLPGQKGPPCPNLPAFRRSRVQARAQFGLIVLCLVGVSLLEFGCTTYIRPDHLSDDPLSYLARIASRRELVDHLALDVRATIASSVFGVDARAILVAQRPRDLRVEVLTPTDDLVAIMTANENTFVHYERGASVCYTGPPCLENTARLLPIPMEVANLVEFLMGGSPLLVRGTPTLEWDAYEGLQVLRIHQTNGNVQRVSFEPCAGHVRKVELFFGGVLQMRVENDGWTWSRGVWLPGLVRLEFPEQNLVAELVVLAADPWMPIDHSATVFECPVGVEMVYLPCPR
ncbi:MAG: hypothetical protein HUU55_02740 [Myxococcales bacterium]|nr:hypothetical protein [Myxococcales bacterium]